jgi:hypothetical protein
MKRLKRYLAVALFAAIVAVPPLGMLYWAGFFNPQAPVSAFDILRAPERSVYTPPSGPNNPNDYYNNSPMRTNREGLYNITWRG